MPYVEYSINGCELRIAGMIEAPPDVVFKRKRYVERIIRSSLLRSNGNCEGALRGE
jgi:hypothetical protein